MRQTKENTLQNKLQLKHTSYIPIFPMLEPSWYEIQQFLLFVFKKTFLDLVTKQKRYVGDEKNLRGLSE